MANAEAGAAGGEGEKIDGGADEAGGFVVLQLDHVAFADDFAEVDVFVFDAPFVGPIDVADELQHGVETKGCGELDVGCLEAHAGTGIKRTTDDEHRAWRGARG